MKEIIVIGGGLMGTSVAWKLAQQGAKVRLLEKQGAVYDQGSSYGAARISRSLGPKWDVFSYVHNQTVQETKELIQFLNKQKGIGKHQIEDVYRTSPVSYLYHQSQQEQIDQLNFKKQRQDYKVAAGQMALAQFGAQLSANEILVREYRKHSGTINPAALIEKLRLGIIAKKGRISFNSRVNHIVKKADTFQLTILDTTTSQQHTMKAKKIVVAAGPYNPFLLRTICPGLSSLITPKRVLLGYFRITKKRYRQLTSAERENILAAQPAFSQIGKEYFSMIEKFDVDGSPIFKAGGHQIRHGINELDDVWTMQASKEELKWIKKQFLQYHQMLGINLSKKDVKLVDAYNCVYSETPNNIPIVTYLKDKKGNLDKRLVLVGGMSGIGAKGCLGYGKIAANLILDKKGDNTKIYKKAVKVFGNI
ncbi:MAG: FAD-dependent oxidoreductase [Bacteroidota bacterium]